MPEFIYIEFTSNGMNMFWLESLSARIKPDLTVLVSACSGDTFPAEKYQKELLLLDLNLLSLSLIKMSRRHGNMKWCRGLTSAVGSCYETSDWDNKERRNASFSLIATLAFRLFKSFFVNLPLSSGTYRCVPACKLHIQERTGKEPPASLSQHKYLADVWLNRPVFYVLLASSACC